MDINQYIDENIITKEAEKTTARKNYAFLLIRANNELGEKGLEKLLKDVDNVKTFVGEKYTDGVIDGVEYIVTNEKPF